MRCLLTLILTLSTLLPCRAQEKPSEDDWLCGEGRGATLEEADREALRDLGTRVCVAVSSLSRSEEEQETSSGGSAPSRTRYRSSVRSRVSLSSSVILPDADRTVIRDRTGYTVIRRIPRSRAGEVLSARCSRVLDYEARARSAERGGRLSEALRFHCWALLLLRSLGCAGDLRSGDGGLLRNDIPGRMDALFDCIRVSASGSGDALTLLFFAEGRDVGDVEFTYFDGARWSAVRRAEGGRATVEMAPGALAETIQVRIEYVFRAEALADPELAGILLAAGAPPMKRSLKIFRRI